MIEEHEPCLHALDVEPRSARTGDVVAFALRLRNDGSRSADPGTLRLLLPTGLEPLDPLEVALGGVAPGEEFRATFRARIGTGLDNRTELAAQALIVLPDTVHPTNRCAVRVHTTARFDGPASGTRVERVDAQTVRVIALVTNEGDGPAKDVVLAVRAPAGCVRVDAAGPTLVHTARLEPGETLSGELLARIEAPHGFVCADECDITSRDAATRLLPVRSGVPLEAQLADPELRVVSGRACVEVHALIRNVGWADAHDVPVSIILPPPLRVAGATLRIDALPYGLRTTRAVTASPVCVLQGRAPVALRLARVPAQGTTEIAFAVFCPTNAPPVTIEILAGERRAAAALHAPATRDVRLRIVDAPRWIESRGSGRLTIEVFNAGDAAQDLSIELEAAHAVADTVHVRARAGTLQLVDLNLQVAAAGGEHTAHLSGEVVARDDEGDRARLAFSLPLRDRVWLALDGPPAAANGQLVYVVKNVGPTTARDLRVEFGSWSSELEPIPPGECRRIAVDESPATHGGAICRGDRSLLLLPAAGGAPAELAASLAAAGEVAYGAPLRVRLSVDARDAVEELELQIDADPACPYVLGSTTIDGRALAEDAGPAHLHRGLRLRRLASGTHMEIAWSQLPTAMPVAGAVTVSGSLCVEGKRQTFVPLEVRVRERDPYACGFTTAAYAVNASLAEAADVVVMPAAAEPAPPDAVAVAFRADWHDATRRLLQCNGQDGLLPHILALRALFPDRELSGDAALAGLLEAARTALRDVFDRLFVKARIPGFPIAAEDIEDPALRVALCALFEALVGGVAGSVAGAAAPTAGVWRRVDRRAAQSACAVLTAAPLGAPAVLRTLTLLVPTHSDDDAAAAAVAQYAGELDEVLRACAQAPLEAFDRALGSGRYPALDAAREALVGAVAARASRAAPW